MATGPIFRDPVLPSECAKYQEELRLQYIPISLPFWFPLVFVNSLRCYILTTLFLFRHTQTSKTREEKFVEFLIFPQIESALLQWVDMVGLKGHKWNMWLY